MLTTFVAALLVLNVITLMLLIFLLRRGGAQGATRDDVTSLGQSLQTLELALAQKFSAATADMAQRLEGTKSELKEQVAARLNEGLTQVRTEVQHQLAAGRAEQADSLRASTATLEAKFKDLVAGQAQSLTEARQELTGSLAQTAATLKGEVGQIRSEVEQKLAAIGDQVQTKLDQNIKEGFAQFEKVQEHLKNAESQLANVASLGISINDLNSLLKLPHLRGRFGEESLERLLADFLPAHMYELQSGPENSRGRADAMILFPDRKLPIDAKFPREQVLALFDEKSTPAAIEEARSRFAVVMKEQGKRVAGYIQPENGTTDMALLYLPSETLYMECIRNRELSEALHGWRVFPVSPNTLIVTLQSIAMVYKWYQAAKLFEKSTKELAKAQKHFSNFQGRFEAIGKSLEKAQEAYSTASTHLSKYRTRVTELTGEELPDLEEGGQQSLTAGAS